jgi:hypothetical protein
MYIDGRVRASPLVAFGIVLWSCCFCFCCFFFEVALPWCFRLLYCSHIQIRHVTLLFNGGGEKTRDLPSKLRFRPTKRHVTCDNHASCKGIRCCIPVESSVLRDPCERWSLRQPKGGTFQARLQKLLHLLN